MCRLQGLLKVLDRLVEAIGYVEVEGCQSRQDKEFIGLIQSKGLNLGLLLLQVLFSMQESVQLIAHLLGIGI